MEHDEYARAPQMITLYPSDYRCQLTEILRPALSDSVRIPALPTHSLHRHALANRARGPLYGHRARRRERPLDVLHRGLRQIRDLARLTGSKVSTLGAPLAVTRAMSRATSWGSSAGAGD